MFEILAGSDTIFALSTGVGKSAIAVVRISGPEARLILNIISDARLSPRRTELATIFDPVSREAIDRGIVIWFPGPKSFTGEDCAELQVHGSRAVVAAIARILAALPNVRPAKPGEFTRRALANGKLDLIGAEALVDLVDAETEAQRRLAILQQGGELQRFAERLREEIVDLVVDVETALDFSDELESDAALLSGIEIRRLSIVKQLNLALSNYAQGERIRDGLTVLIAGPPNAGKSSLLNALARRDVAIVSELAGTTRDLIEVKLDLGGYPVNLIDTAGFRVTEDVVEREGLRRAAEKAKSADLLLWLTPSDEPSVSPPLSLDHLPTWPIYTKADLAVNSGFREAIDADGLSISVLTRDNVDLLIERLKVFAEENMSIEGSVMLANERQRQAIISAHEAIKAAGTPHLAIELVAQELRRACFALEVLLGKVGVDDILDRLFSRFCIGK